MLRLNINDTFTKYTATDVAAGVKNARGVLAIAGEPVIWSMLNAAAATHSRDMALQNRPWHFGSDGSSPLDRVARVGYSGTLAGETISETYESEVETLAAWMQQDDTRAVILDPKAQDMGFAWFQEGSGKIWWTLVMGSRSVNAVQLADFQG